MSDSESLWSGDGLASRVFSQPTTTPTILINKCPLFREGLKQALDGSAFTVVASRADLNDVRLMEALSGTPHLIILGASSDIADDLAAVKCARLHFPGSEIVSLRRDCTRQQAALLLRAGVAAILPTPNRPDRFIDVLDLVMLGQHVVPLYLMGCCADLGEAEVTNLIETNRRRADIGRVSTNLSRLSTREVEIVRCLLAGEPNRSIARRLTISEATVKVHVKAIRRKIKVKNRTQAAIWALNNMEAAEDIAAAPIASRAIEHMAALQSSQIFREPVRAF